MGVSHTKLGALAIHQCGKPFDATSDVTCQSAADVVGAFHHENLKQLTAGVLLAGFEVEFGRFAERVVRSDGDGLVKIAGIEDTEGGDDFLSRGDSASLIRVFRVEAAIARDIDDENAFGGNGRRRILRYVAVLERAVLDRLCAGGCRRVSVAT